MRCRYGRHIDFGGLAVPPSPFSLLVADALDCMPGSDWAGLWRCGHSRMQPFLLRVWHTEVWPKFLPGPELTLHASVHSALVAERNMLVEALGSLGPDDVLVLDRGYPAAWLVALLNARGIRFVMRCDNHSGWNAGKAFLRSGEPQATVKLNAPTADEVGDWACPAGAPEVRLVRQTAPNGQVRLLATNLDAIAFPAALFGELYHQRWRIEEAFKRIKHRLKLES